ncbi:MAG: HNH endonuclease [Candidatus Celaenobacter polaris]|nr:HNH endonuclease [Candidatus Celaenobacter polaris]
MAKLTSSQREEIIRRRGTKSDKTGKKGRIDNLEIHHKDRNTNNNDPQNLRVLTKKEHDDLHGRAGD